MNEKDDYAEYHKSETTVSGYRRQSGGTPEDAIAATHREPMRGFEETDQQKVNRKTQGWSANYDANYRRPIK